MSERQPALLGDDGELNTPVENLWTNEDSVKLNSLISQWQQDKFYLTVQGKLLSSVMFAYTALMSLWGDLYEQPGYRDYFGKVVRALVLINHPKSDREEIRQFGQKLGMISDLKNNKQFQAFVNLETAKLTRKNKNSR